MSARPLATSDGLSAAELVHLIVFAANADLCVETSTAEDGSQYATLSVSKAAGPDDHRETWVVSREQGVVTAFHETSGPLPRRATVADVLLDLRETLQARRMPRPHRPLGTMGLSASHLARAAAASPGHTPRA